MQYRFNKKFVAFGGDYLLEIEEACKLPASLLGQKIVFFDGCYFYESLINDIGYSDYFIDATGNECFFNKIHVEDYLDELESDKMLAYGISYAKHLSKKLGQLNEGEFNVILSYDEETCTIRFHKCREEEDYLAQDLETYLSDAILVVTK